MEKTRCRGTGEWYNRGWLRVVLNSGSSPDEAWKHGLAPATRGVFTIARLDDVFDFVEDKFAALAHLQILG